MALIRIVLGGGLLVSGHGDVLGGGPSPCRTVGVWFQTSLIFRPRWSFGLVQSVFVIFLAHCQFLFYPMRFFLQDSKLKKVENAQNPKEHHWLKQKQRDSRQIARTGGACLDDYLGWWMGIWSRVLGVWWGEGLLPGVLLWSGTGGSPLNTHFYQCRFV